MIISLSGKTGSGKDTAGKLIQLIEYRKIDKDVREVPVNESTIAEWLSFSNKTIEFHSKWQIKKWADSLRQVVALMLGISVEITYSEEFKKWILPECWNYEVFNHGMKDDVSWMKIGWETRQMTGRDFLQKLGTDAIRNGLHTNTWVNCLMVQYRIIGMFKGSLCPNWIITDTRFPNELEAIKKVDGMSIKILRSNIVDSPTLQHESETALDQAKFDHIVMNDGSLTDLFGKLYDILT